MLKLIVIIALLTVGIAESKWYPTALPLTPNGRIVGGEPTTIEQVPHQVSLQAYGFAFCGATIIGKNWVLTAAHCTSYGVNTIKVRAGTSYKAAGGTVHNVVEIIKHEKYTTNNYGIPINDIAVLKVETPFDIDETRQAIQLFDYQEESIVGIHSTITGWGAAVEGGSTTEVINTVNVPIIHKEVCSEAYERFGGLPEGQICAAYPEGGKDACQGDSGGPLTILGRLAGIVSWGNGCARPGYPGVYTEVAAYRQWIKEHTEV
ncbi:hypothetical protein PV327_009748 [Microctonus hyperodae]|uniref:Peptidase S1 domain-containing protein n=1 Tax=Microctonus hyperodae TaxID=165561 RepID=A0AA39CB41_MICHY|nr:hypothetical protein PV327_009748 [Microctonus hyperodae]